ncbi:MAG: alpha/beta hydrolase [Hyphomicrobiaceae bacterium]
MRQTIIPVGRLLVTLSVVVMLAIAGCASQQNLTELASAKKMHDVDAAPPSPPAAARTVQPRAPVSTSVSDTGKREEIKLARLPDPSSGPAMRTRGARAFAATAPTKKSDKFDVVSVFWGTNRRTLDGRNGRLAFAPLNDEQLNLGLAQVTIPKIGRKPGTLQRPKRYAVLGYEIYKQKADPRKHFTIGDLKKMTRSQFVAATDRVADKSTRFKDQAFVFVHGYNTTFEGAVFRTAQLTVDLEFDGLPFLFSWPSRSQVLAYVHDRDQAEAAEDYFLEYLELIATKTKAKRIHLIAHSLGTQLVTAALKSIANNRAKIARLNIEQIVLAAPDINQKTFAKIADAIKSAGRAVTVYASADDQALITSKRVAGGLPRVGEVTSAGPVIIPGIDTIDITAAGFNTLWSLNHSTFAKRSHILKDLQLLLERGTRPPDRRMPLYRELKVAAGQSYWKYFGN